MHLDVKLNQNHFFFFSRMRTLQNEKKLQLFALGSRAINDILIMADTICICAEML